MGWAGALEGIFLEFEKEFKATPLNLYQNFRSLPRIRRVHNSMVKDMDPEAAIDDEALQGDEGIVSIQEFENDDEEAKWIAESIITWRDSGIPLKEIAVLCKTQPHLYAAPLMARLADQGIPFRNEQETQDLVCEPIFKIALDYLIVLLGSGESDSWERLTSTLCPEEFDDTDDLRARDWNQFIQDQKIVINGSRDFDAAWLSVEALLQKLGDEGVTSLSVDYEDKARFEDLVKSTKDQIKDCFDPAQECVQALKGLSEINAVRILTIHKCKGLEFHTVVVQGVEEENFWGDQEAASCAYFVAISRAKEQLVVTTSAYRERPDGHTGAWRTNRNPQSDFLGYVEPHVGGDS
jgi:superfamily I DNA/RNA helicase